MTKQNKIHREKTFMERIIKATIRYNQHIDSLLDNHTGNMKCWKCDCDNTDLCHNCVNNGSIGEN